MSLIIHETSIFPRNFKVGMTLERGGCQYEIVDYEGSAVSLRELPPDERVKPEFIHGRFI